jgi:hypothetical protein
VLGYQRGKAKPTGRPYEIEFVHLWSLHHGRFTEFWVFDDTAGLVEALRRWDESSQWWYFHFNACRACSKSWSLYDSFDATIVSLPPRWDSTVTNRCSCSEVLPTSAASWIACLNLLCPLVELKKRRALGVINTMTLLHLISIKDKMEQRKTS